MTWKDNIVSHNNYSRLLTLTMLYSLFIGYSWSCLDGESGIDCTLEDLLVFFSGADCIPPLGFGVNPILVFVNITSATLPTASTCDVQLRLPATHKDYHKFKYAMVLGLKGNDGFGGVWCTKCNATRFSVCLTLIKGPFSSFGKRYLYTILPMSNHIFSLWCHTCKF